MVSRCLDGHGRPEYWVRDRERVGNVSSSAFTFKRRFMAGIKPKRYYVLVNLGQEKMTSTESDNVLMVLFRLPLSLTLALLAGEGTTLMKSVANDTLARRSEETDDVLESV